MGTKDRFTLEFLVCAFFSAAAVPPVHADIRTVRAGISEYPHYAYVDETGTLAGADVEYAYRLAQYADINLDIVLIPDAQSYFRALEDGSVDMLFDVIRTPERERKYLYADRETASTPMSLYVRNEDERFEYGNITQLHKYVFGSEKGSEVTAVFRSWAERHGFSPVIREYTDMSDVNSALDAHQIDAAVYGAGVIDKYKTILRFDPLPYYIIFRKDSYALKDAVDNAMDRLQTDDPVYMDTLLRKYLENEHEVDALTQQEHAYIAGHPRVTVAVLKNDEPYFTQKRDGTCAGIIPEYYQTLSERSGLKFAYDVCANQDEAVEAVKSGRADIIGIFSDGLISAHDEGLRLTNPYGQVTTVLVTRSGSGRNDIRTIAVKNRSRKMIQSWIGPELHAQIEGYDTAKESFNAFQIQAADAVICGLPSATWLINQTNSAAYSMTTISPLTLDLCGAVDYSSATLCSVLDKAISTTGYSFSGIITRNTMPEKGWIWSLARIPPGKLALFIASLVVIIVILALSIVSLVHRQREREAFAAVKAENDRRETKLAVLEKTTEERNMFFSNISHDMRTPLNAIIGFSRLASEKAVSDEIKEYLEKIRASGELLVGLVDDTLTLSKMNSGKLHLNPLPIYTTDLIDPLILPIRATAELRKITLEAENTVQRRIVLADALNVQKILLNLLSNAVKYTPEGGTVRFSAADDSSGGIDPDIVFTVSDTGIGMKSEFLAHIYEPFVQENRSGDSAAGTGLGLSIVKHLVDMMDGSINVESTVNKGTTFIVRLHLPQTDEKPEPKGLAAGLGSELSGQTVLLCEDNDMNTEIACAILSAKGIIPVTASNGKTGVQKFLESRPGTYSAILMDLRMPVMTGYEAVKQIRSAERSDAEKIPIIAMTADAFADDAEKCFEVGMNAHITKPLDPDKVYHALSMLIKEYREKK